MDRASPWQRLESFLKTLGEPNGAKGALPRAREIEQEEKTLIWSSASEAKLNLASFAKKLQGGAVRDVVRQEIKQLLKENDIQLTGDIKKALPSRLSPGDAARLSQLISPSSMPLLINDVASLKPHLQHEIRKLIDTVPEGKDAHLADFLINNTGPVHKSLVALIQPSMTDHAENIASEAYEAFATALMFGRTIDDAMDRAYQRSNASYEDIKPSKELFEVATCITNLLDAEMGKKGRSEKAQQNFEAFINDGKKTLMPALMIAAFIPVLVTSLDKRQKGFDLAIEDFCVIRGAAKPAENLDYEQRPKVEIDVAELWRMKPSVIAERLAGKISSIYA